MFLNTNFCMLNVNKECYTGWWIITQNTIDVAFYGMYCKPYRIFVLFPPTDWQFINQILHGFQFVYHKDWQQQVVSHTHTHNVREFAPEMPALCHVFDSKAQGALLLSQLTSSGLGVRYTDPHKEDYKFSAKLQFWLLLYNVIGFILLYFF